MITKPAITNEKIHDLMQNRWSPRAFDLNKPVSASDLIALLEAARWAPSCMNEQLWHFLVCDKYQDETAWQTLLACLAEKNQQWAAKAPVLLLSVAAERFSQNDKVNRWAAYDTGAASLNLCLQATALGLVTHQMGGFDVEVCRKQFKISEHYSPMAVIAIGYQADADGLNEEFKQRELAERSRADLNERFYFGRWN